MKLKLLMAIICCWYTIIPTAQPVNNIKPLTVGDKVPPLIISNVINHPSAQINLAELKGKLVILDFWSSWCGACITLFPHLQQLQNRFGDSIAIILVNTKSHLSKDDAAKINTILTKVYKRTGTRISLPVSFNNSMLDHYFPSIFLPHEVWISPDGTVKAITTANELSEANLSLALHDILPQMQIKKDDATYNSAKPLFVDNNGGTDTAMRYRSILCGYLPGLGSAIGLRLENNMIKGVYLINQPLKTFVKSAYPQFGGIPDNRTVIKLKDKQYNVVATTQENKAWIYSYDLTIPPCHDSAMRIYLQQDIQRYFNLHVFSVKKTLSCLVLYPKEKNVHPSSRQPDLDLEKETLEKYIYNYNITTALEVLNKYTTMPVIFEGAGNPDISINLPFSLVDNHLLAKAFEDAGFTATFSTRKMDVLVVTDSANEIIP